MREKNEAFDELGSGEKTGFTLSRNAPADCYYD